MFKLKNILQSEAGSGDGTSGQSAETKPTEPVNTGQPAGEPGNKPIDPPADKSGEQKVKEETKPAVPEKYDIKVPEGQEIDKDALSVFEPVAKELGLSNEQAQKLVDIYGKAIAPKLLQQQADSWQKQVSDWSEAVKNDKEIGGKNLTENISVAQKALDTFGSPVLKEFLETTGLGNHPELIKAFVKIGKSIGEDKFHLNGDSGHKDPASVLYPNQK